jgi:glycosyltransferase involved in cell wall biosynthesis
MPKVSIIMPTFNRAWIINRAVESILNQKFKDFELLIVDDGSTDNTLEILKTYTDPRIKIYSTKHGGQSKARNFALKKAQGQFIAFLDSDNLWYKNFLAVMIRSLGNHVFAYSGQKLYNLHKDKILGTRIRNHKLDLEKLRKTNYIDTGCVLIKRSVIEKIGGFNPRLKNLEDWDLWKKIARKYPKKIKHVNRVLGEYFYFTRASAKTVTNSFTEDEKISNYFNHSDPIK